MNEPPEQDGTPAGPASKSESDSVTLVLTDAVAGQLAELAADPRERAGVLRLSTVEQGGRLRLLARQLWEPPEDSYLTRDSDGLELASSGWMPALALAEAAGDAAMFVHSHPGGVPLPSEHDAVVDGQLAEPFRLRTGRRFYASLVVAPDPGPFGFSFTGQVLRTTQQQALPVGRALRVGRRIALASAYDSPPEQGVPELYTRQVAAFGGDVQEVLGCLRFGVAGSGGTGSALVEQLVRLGVRDLVLADPDVLSDSNVTRVYGSTPADVGRLKVDVQRGHLSRIAPDLHLQTLPGRTIDREVAEALAGCDVLFGCTDDDAGRIVLSRLASYCLLPLVDCGVLLSSRDGTLQGIDSRVTTVVPGSACLLCRDRIDLQRASAEVLPPDELAARQKEGYAPELGNIEPAVVSYTTLTAALAVAELLERLTGYGRDPAPSEVLARLHDRELSTNSRRPREHFCNPTSTQFAAGDRAPFLDWTWSA